MTEEEIRIAFGRHVEAGIFNPIRRHLRPDIADDRMAEGLGLIFEIFKAKALIGVELDAALLVHAARLRACDLTRRLVRGGQPARDAFHEPNFHQGKVETLHLDGVPEEIEFPGEGDAGLEALALEGLSIDPADWINSAIDLVSWLDGLPAEDRKLLELRQQGHTFQEIGLRLRVTLSKACHRVRALGFELAARMGVSVEGCNRAAPFEVAT